MHDDCDEEEMLWWLHWITAQDISSAHSSEWTFMYGDDLSLDGDLTELRKLVIKVRNTKKRFLLQSTRFREENPITFDPDCLTTLRNVMSELDLSEKDRIRIQYHITKILEPAIIDENSSQVIKRLFELILECGGIEESREFLQEIIDSVTCPINCLKLLLPMFSQKASQQQFKECLFKLATEAIYHNLTKTLRLLLELELDPNSCDERGESLIIMSFHSNFMPGVKLLKKYGARNPSLDEIRKYQESNFNINDDDYDVVQLNKILYPKGTTAQRSLKHLSIGSIRRLPNFEDKITILPVPLQKDILTFDEIFDE